MECPEWEIHVVAAEIAQVSVSEIPPVSPIEMEVGFVEIAERCRAEPKVVVDVFWWGVCFWGLHTKRASGTSNPNVNAFDGADDSLLDEFDNATVVVAGMDLVSHLCWDFCFSREFSDDTCFVNGVREWFFAVDGESFFQSCDDSDRVEMVGGGDDDAIEVVSVEQFSVVCVECCFGIFFGCNAHSLGIDITKCDDVFFATAFEISCGTCSGSY